MTTVSGPLVNVTTSASSVRDVQVHTKKVRAWGDGLMTPDPSQATLSNGVVEFEAAPGPVVMVLFMAEAGAETVSLVVGEGATQSLADAYRDGQMASDRDASELAGILEQIRASVGESAEARAGAEAAAVDAAGSAAAAGRDADRAEAAAGEAATEAAGLAADAVRLEVKGDADRSAAGATTATEKAAEAAGSATRAETAETGAVEAEEGAVAGQELSEDAAAVAVAAAEAFEGHSPQQVVDAAGRAEAAADRVGSAEQVGTWAAEAEAAAGRAETAADRVGSVEQVEEWVGDAQAARDEAQEAETGAKAAEGGAVGHATAAGLSATSADTAAGEATRAATTAQEIATNLPATIQNELDDRVPPEVAEALASDRVVADAVAEAVGSAADDIKRDRDNALQEIREAEATGVGSVDDAEQDALEEIQLQLNNALQNIITTADGEIPFIDNGTDWNTLLNGGFYRKKTSSSTDSNAPDPNKNGIVPVGGLLVFEHGNISDTVGQLWFGQGVAGLWHRATLPSGTWTEWSQLLSTADPLWHRVTSGAWRIIPPDADFNTLTAPGLWRGRYSSATDTNAPIVPPGNRPTGTLIVLEHGTTSGTVSQIFAASSSHGLYYRSKTSSAWMPWVRLDKPDLTPGENDYTRAVNTGAARREVLVEDFRTRRGGSIGTRGRGVIALRFDHHLDSFNEKIVPILKKYRLPWGQAINPGKIGTGDDNMTMAALQALCIESGGEVHNHGMTHGNKDDRAGLEYEIIDSLEALKSGLPLLPIDGWMQPGTGGSFGGMSPYTDASNYFDTESGRMVLSHHPVVYGHRWGYRSRLDGTLPIGLNHYGFGSVTLTSIKNRIDEAASRREGVVLMAHPNYLDQAGNLSTEDFDAAMAYLAGQRAAGRVDVLSPTAFQLADASHGTRTPVARIDLSAQATIRESLGFSRTQVVDGVHEVHLVAQSDGPFTVSVSTDNGLSVTWTVTPTGGWAEEWLPFSIPVGAEEIYLTVTGASAGFAEVRAA